LGNRLAKALNCDIVQKQFRKEIPAPFDPLYVYHVKCLLKTLSNYLITFMPNLDNAKKALRVAKRKRVINDRRRRTMKLTVKTVKVSKTPEDLAKAYQAIDKAAKRGVIKKNTASRKKSRLTKSIQEAK
jgi:small subunit ribosomal protein S20